MLIITQEPEQGCVYIGFSIDEWLFSNHYWKIVLNNNSIVVQQCGTETGLTALYVAFLSAIPCMAEIFNFSLGLELVGMVGQNLNC